MAEYKPPPSRPPPAAQPQNVWADMPNPNSGSTEARARLLESQPISLIPNVTNARLYTMCSRREVPANTPEMKQWDGKLTESPMEAYLKNVRGGLDAVRGDQWGYQVAQQLPDAALNEVGGFLIGKVIGKLADALGWRRLKGGRQIYDPPTPAPVVLVGPRQTGVVILKPKIIYVNPKSLKPRQDASEMTNSKVERYKKNMKKNGYNESKGPILVVEYEGKYIITDGHHRALAAAKARIEQVPIQVINVTPDEARIIWNQAQDAAASHANRTRY